MDPHQRQRLGLLALLGTVVVAGALAASHATTVDSHEQVITTLELERRVTSLRVWIQRGTSEVRGGVLGLPGSEPGLAALEEARRAGSTFRVELRPIDAADGPAALPPGV